ncbi:von Willebrand factor A domain-containing protein 1-like [Heptranchias perlo]|uniref:von Willebrand factor A domain-containing protein 1-like n=1 Tax=Heptranchias perlo TaxID=212740 RepID=UPI00355A383E
MIGGVLLIWLSFSLSVLGKGIQESKDATACGISELPADLLLVLDGSGSVSPYEFAMAAGLLGRLASCLELGPGRARLGLLQLGGRPAVELPLEAGASRERLGLALRGLRQLGGDTNSGPGLSMAAGMWGPPGPASPLVPRVLIWVTDGCSTDRLEGPAEVLRRAGVFCIVVTTGRRVGGLKHVASRPLDDFLFFIETDQLLDFAPRLCRAVRDLISPAELTVQQVRAESLSLSWRRLAVSASEGYLLEYGPWDPQERGGARLRIELPWDARGHVLRSLRPNTDYQVSLRVRGVDRGELQTRVTTLRALTGPTGVSVKVVSASSLGLDWSPSPNTSPGRDNNVGFNLRLWRQPTSSANERDHLRPSGRSRSHLSLATPGRRVPQGSGLSATDPSRCFPFAPLLVSLGCPPGPIRPTVQLSLGWTGARTSDVQALLHSSLLGG